LQEFQRWNDVTLIKQNSKWIKKWLKPTK
jgi:hypothetical protein